MKPQELTAYLEFAIKNTFPVMITGIPGIGKSDIVEQSAKKAGAELIISHPVVSDPTDFKGLPFAKDDGTASFLPFGDLNELIKADKPTVFFLDDIGQAPVSVQAACMQLILARRINGHKVSDKVTFVAATNRKSDKAGVSGIIEPVKSRFTIVGLEVEPNDWLNWAFSNNMPIELISFIKFRPEHLSKFEPTKDITNTPTPRNIAEIGKQQNAGIPSGLEREVFMGRCGEAFAGEYSSFMKIYRNLPNFEMIVNNPTKTAVSTEPSIQYALAGMLANRLNDQNIDAVVTYMDRLPAEIAVATMQMAIQKDAQITFNRAFGKWSADKGNLI